MKIKFSDFGSYAEKYKDKIIVRDNCYTMDREDILNLVSEAIQHEELISVSISSSDIECKEAAITEILKEIGVPSHIRGYNYLIKAILVYAEKPGKIKNIYIETARICNVNATAVERAIRSAIESAWEKGNPYALDKYFGYSVSPSKGKATNNQFISAIAKTIMSEKSECV